MKKKKSIIIIFTLIIMILPMMTINVQAATLAKVYNLESKMQGNIVYFSWNKVTNADGYDIYINTSNKGYQYIGSVNSAEVSVIGFQEDETYSAKVCAYQINNNGEKEAGKFSDAIEVNTTPETVLGKVTTLTATQNGGNVTLNWSKVNYADGYQVFVNIPNFGYMNIGSVNTTSAIITGFQDGKTYEFKVRAYEKITSETLNYGDFSPSKSLKINEDKYENDNEYVDEIEEPAQVTGITINDIVENQVKISWNKVSDADGYDIWLSKSNGSFSYISTVYKNSATLSNLDYDTNYRIIIVSYKNTDNGTIYGPDSAKKSFTTEQEERTLDQVKNLNAELNGNTVSLSWSKVTNADGYNIYVAENSTSNYKYKKSTTSRSTTLTDLEYNTTYRVKVCAYERINGKEIQGPFSNVEKFTTEKKQSNLAKVTHLNTEVINRNEVEISWWPVEGAYGYEIYFSKNGGSYQKVCDTIPCNATIYSLDYNTNYKVKVRAYQYVNGSKVYSKYYSSVESFKTEKYYVFEGNENVPRVQNVNANVNGDTVHLTWTPVSGAVKYEVDFTVPGIGGSCKYIVYTNSKSLSGLTEKVYKYTARVRAYKYVDGKLVAGPYSYLTKFSGK